MTDAAPSNASPAPEDDVTTALYRAAIGPINTNYFLPIFTRFEAADHAGISWNTAASLLTLNWLVFRRLWVAALAYAATMVTLVLLVFGIGRLVFQFSDTLMMALGLGFGLAAFVLPGLFGNAVLHTDCRKKMSKALAAHASVADACAQLSRQASSRKRAIALAIANGVMLLVAVALYFQFSAMDSVPAPPQEALDAGRAKVGRATELERPAKIAAAANDTRAAATATTATTATTAASAASAASAAAPATAASAPLNPVSEPPLRSDKTTSKGTAPVQSAAASASAASRPRASSVVARSPAATEAPLPRATASAPRSKASSSKTALTASPKEPPAPAVEADPTRGSERVTKRPKTQASTAAKQPSAAQQSATAAADAGEKPFFINVGLFAKPENAANAHAKLVAAQLPSVIRELKSKKGPQIRVRVGPFATQEEANVAAQQIKALDLDAMIVQP